MSELRPGVLLVLTRDPVALRGLERVASELGLALEHDAAQEPRPAAVVLDLESPEALEEVAHRRAQFPEALVAGHLAGPRHDLWLQAEAAGCDLVASRGALAARLRDRLGAWEGPSRPRTLLFAAADVAGRLGCVYRASESPVGPLAVYHLQGRLYAVEDACPHAGAALSEGELEGTVVTCPRHGSRFDLRTGERLRGPADLPLRTHALVEEGGYVYLLAP